MSRIRANQITNQSADGAPTVQNGLVISGVTTSTTFSGSGASLTNLNGSNIASGTVPVARIGTGTKNTSTFYRGDGSFATVTSTTINNNADNRLITGSGTANTLEGEATLTFTNSGSAGQVNLKRSTSTDQEAIFYYGSSNLEIETREATGIKLKTNKSDRVILTSGGNLGIGNRTSSPDNLLHVHTSSGDAVAHIEGAADGKVRLRAHSGQSIVQFADSASSTVGEIVYDHASNYLKFHVNGSERARIDSSGNIKIGESNSGNVAFSLVTNGSGMLLSKGTTGNPSNGQTLGDIGFNAYSDSQTTSSADALIRGQAAGNFSGSSAPTDLLFFTKPASTGPGSGPTERMRINKDGIVTQSQQPSFAAFRNTGSYGLNNEIFPLGSVRHNVGSHYNTGNYRFTAPVAGRYLFTFYSILNSQINSGHYEIRVNNSAGNGQSIHFTTTNSSWDHVSSSHLLNLSANDYVTMWSNSSVGWHGGSWQLFCGELLS